jgi:flagellar motility protein MotE (MotC chaperone)
MSEEKRFNIEFPIRWDEDTMRRLKKSSGERGIAPYVRAAVIKELDREDLQKEKVIDEKLKDAENLIEALKRQKLEAAARNKEFETRKSHVLEDILKIPAIKNYLDILKDKDTKKSSTYKTIFLNNFKSINKNLKNNGLVEITEDQLRSLLK